MSAVPWTSRNGGRPGRTWRSGEASRRTGRAASSSSVRPKSARIERLRPPRRSVSDSRSTGAKNGTTAATRASAVGAHGRVGHEVAAGRLAHEGEPLRVEAEAAPFVLVQRTAARRPRPAPGSGAGARGDSSTASQAMPAFVSGRTERARRPACGRRRSSRRRGRGSPPGTGPCREACRRRAAGSRRPGGRTRGPAGSAPAAGTGGGGVGRRSPSRRGGDAALRGRVPAVRAAEYRGGRQGRGLLRRERPRPRDAGAGSRARARRSVLRVAGGLLALRPVPVVPALGPHDLRHLGAQEDDAGEGAPGAAEVGPHLGRLAAQRRSGRTRSRGAAPPGWTRR